jgi:hypothetical protein
MGMKIGIEKSVMGLSQATSDGEQAAVFLQKQKKS